MTLQLPLRLALVAALAAVAGAAFAQETLDAVEPAQTDAVAQNETPEAAVPTDAVAVEMVEDAEVADADVDRRCLEATGSRVNADPQPATAKDNTERNGEDCTIGNGIALHWYPTRVTIAGEGDIAWSSGPSVVEHLDPKAKHRYTLGGFHSVWHRADDGTWHVLFDDGIPSRPATAEDVAAFHAGRREACPQG